MAGYTRNDTSNNIATGNIINASDLDGEFDAIQTAFDATTGHNHDGTVGEGVPITVTGPAQDFVSGAADFRPKADNTYDLGTSANEWKDLYVDGVGYIDTLTADAGTVAGAAITTISNTQTLTNKTINLSNNTLVATSAQLAAALTDETGTGSVVFSASPALTGTPTAPTAAAGTNTTQIATTAHVFAERTNTATLTNKTISVDDNTVSGIAASSFVLSNASGNINGAAAQKAIPTGVVVGTTDTQTLTNKTLNTATLNSPTINTLVNVAGNATFNTTTLFVDGTNSRIGFGTTTPSHLMHATAVVSAAFTSLFRINGAHTAGSLSHGIGFSINSSDISAGIYEATDVAGAALVFATATDYTTPTLTERMRITKDGEVGIGRTPTSGIELDVSGEIRSSVGILFGTDTAAANALDDYEEGTWSPVLTDGTNNATMSASAGGAYTKIGRMVTVTGRVITTALGSVTGPVFISGLPFASGATVGRGTAAFGGTSALAITAGQSITGRILPSASRIEIYLWDSAVGQTALQATEWSDDGDSYFSATYFTA